MIDKELIDECRNGNLQNFRKIFEKTSPMIFSVAFRMLGNDDTARDIVQETMITVWQKSDRIKTPGSFKTWVYRIAVNKCYDYLRKRKHDGEVRMNDEGWLVLSNHIKDETTSDLDNKEIGLIINSLTDKLSIRQKTVFVLSELEELSSEEIKNITGMSRTNIKANLYHARKKMEGLLEKYLKDE